LFEIIFVYIVYKNYNGEAYSGS